MNGSMGPRRLADAPCLAFPLRIENAGPALSNRGAHVRDQIEQVLFTAPGERVFRPEYGAGVKALVFEPNATPLWEVTRRRIRAALGEALRGEVDPNTLEVVVSGEQERMEIVVRYALLALGVTETQRYLIGGSIG